MKKGFQKVHFSFIKIALAILVGFGFISFLTLDTSGTSIDIIHNQLSGRTPASVAEAVDISTETLNVDCLDFNKEVLVKAHQVRIVGKLCDEKKFPETRLENITSTNEPTLFKKKGTFTTDYFNLVEGANVISLRLKDKNQNEIIKNLTLIR